MRIAADCSASNEFVVGELEFLQAARHRIAASQSAMLHRAVSELTFQVVIFIGVRAQFHLIFTDHELTSPSPRNRMGPLFKTFNSEMTGHDQEQRAANSRLRSTVMEVVSEPYTAPICDAWRSTRQHVP